MTKETAPYGPFAGMNNLLPDTKLRKADSPSFVRNAVNVDLTDAGTFSRRQGSVQVVSGTDCHSFWSSDDVGFFVDGGSLYRVVSQGDVPVKSQIATVTPGLRMSYADTGLDVRASNGVQALRIKPDGAVSNWSVETPRYQPSIAAATGGSLTGGICRAVVSYTNAEGEEGATTPPVAVEVQSNGALTVSGIQHVAGLTTNVYLTPVNGDTFYLAAQPSGSTAAFSTTPENGPRPVGLMLAPLPAGNIVRHFNGRLFSAVGSTLFYSQIWQLGLCDPVQNRIEFASQITVVEPCMTGIYVVADKAYWLAGEISQAPLVVALPYGATPGTSGSDPRRSIAWWVSERGMVIGDQTGVVKNVQEKDVAVDPAVVGAALFREQDGMKQMIASLFSPQSTVVAARSYMEAEVVRKETLL